MDLTSWCNNILGMVLYSGAALQPYILMRLVCYRVCCSSAQAPLGGGMQQPTVQHNKKTQLLKTTMEKHAEHWYKETEISWDLNALLLYVPQPGKKN